MPQFRIRRPGDEMGGDFFELQDSSIGVESTPELSRSSSSVGNNGTGAVLGFDHSLMQLSSYAEESLRLVQGSSFNHERPGSMLLHCQNEEDEPKSGWGLSVHPEGERHISRGFIDARWPTQKIEYRSSNKIIVQKSTTYVDDNGRLIQAIAVASKTNCSIPWTLGGKVMLLKHPLEEPEEIDGHHVKISGTGNTLTVGSDLDFWLDVQFFINRKAHRFPPSRNGTSQNGTTSDSSGEHDNDESIDSVDISCNGTLDLEALKIQVLVATYSIRAKTSDEVPVKVECPSWKDLGQHLWLGEQPPPNSLIQTLDQATRLSQIPTKVSLLITRNVEQLLSVAALPEPKEAECQGVHLINNLVGPDFLNPDYEACFWNIRFLAKVLQLATSWPMVGPGDYSSRISAVLFGVIKIMFANSSDIAPDQHAFRVLALRYALPYLDDLQVEEVSKGIDLSPLYPNNSTEAMRDDPVTHLLLWYQRVVLAEENTWDQFYFDSEVGDEAKTQTHAEYAINKNNSRTAIADAAALSEQDFSQRNSMRIQIKHEQRWNQIALLHHELVNSEKKERKVFLNGLVDEVAKRLKIRETRTVGNLPPWGYRCLGHSLKIELAIAETKLGMKAMEDLVEVVQNVYEDCVYFLRSDLLFLKSWDTTDISWMSDHWDINFSSIVNASFLNVATLKRPDFENTNPGQTDAEQRHRSHRCSVDPKLDEILEALRDISQPLRKHVKYPWKANLKIGRQYYPHFMVRSLENRRATTDKTRMSRRLDKLSTENKSKSLVTLFEKNLGTYFPNDRWSVGRLSSGYGDHSGYGDISIFDFPFSESPPIGPGVLKRLVTSRVNQEVVKYRMMLVDRLPPKLLVTYLHFAHPEAWDTVVDYFGLNPVFRPSVDVRDSHDSTGAAIWHTSINIPHFITYKPEEATDPLKLPPNEIPNKYNPIPGAKIFPDVCISICITGDNLGEFWTSSILGTINFCQHGRNNNSSVLKIGDKINEVMGIYMYDKYGARNLVFIVHLTGVCHVISERHEEIKDHIKAFMGLEQIERLYSDIASPEFSTKQTETINKVTKALRKVLWAIEFLGKVDKSMVSALSVIENAERHVESNLAKRRKYWDERLEEYEQENVWEPYRSALARLSSCQIRIEALSRRASGVKDNLIFLSNMSSTQAILTTTVDTSGMKIITILTALFLPFTFVAVFLTTPMFKFPEPPEGQIIMPTPFAIYWGASISLSLIVGGILWQIAESKNPKTDSPLKKVRKWWGGNIPSHESQHESFWRKLAHALSFSKREESGSLPTTSSEGSIERATVSMREKV